MSSRFATPDPKQAQRHQSPKSHVVLVHVLADDSENDRHRHEEGSFVENVAGELCEIGSAVPLSAPGEVQGCHACANNK